MRRSDGQAIAEFAIVFPVQLLLVLGLLQLCFLLIARQMVGYAAYTAARSELVGEDAYWAAQLICSPITGASFSANRPADNIALPGWGTVARSGLSGEKTHVTIDTSRADEEPYVEVTVAHDFELTMPVVNHAFAAAFMGSSYDPYEYGAPHLPLTATCRLARPWAQGPEPRP